jgi:hypothetical protein
MDLVCRLSDGGDATRYTMYEFLNLVNQEAALSQPRFRTNSEHGFLTAWEAALRSAGVRVHVNAQVDRVLLREDGRATSVVTADGQEHRADDIVLAVPPVPLLRLLQASGIPDAFTPGMAAWVEATRYNKDVNVCFHFSERLALPPVYGFPLGDHGYPLGDWVCVHVVLTDYFSMDNPRSLTVVSAAITNVDAPSAVTGRSANQTPDRADLAREVWRQIRPRFGPAALPDPVMVVSPDAYYADGAWHDRNTAFMRVPGITPLPQTGNVAHLYNAGCHNLLASYAFTSLEGAVSNALRLVHRLEPASAARFPVMRLRYLSDRLAPVRAVTTMGLDFGRSLIDTLAALF